MNNKEQLKKLIEKLAIKRGEVTLASGAKANYYIDCRKVTLDSIGAALIGNAIFDLLSANLPDAIGGMAIGADPITGSVISVAGGHGKQISGFIVRKEEKKHGMAQMVEGPIHAGQSATMVEDVVTTVGSSLKALQYADEAVVTVTALVSIVDLPAGVRAIIQDLGITLTSPSTIQTC